MIYSCSCSWKNCLSTSNSNTRLIQTKLISPLVLEAERIDCIKFLTSTNNDETLLLLHFQSGYKGTYCSIFSVSHSFAKFHRMQFLYYIPNIVLHLHCSYLVLDNDQNSQAFHTNKTIFSFLFSFVPYLTNFVFVFVFCNEYCVVYHVDI